jgi:hypothetical protein
VKQRLLIDDVRLRVDGRAYRLGEGRRAETQLICNDSHERAPGIRREWERNMSCAQNTVVLSCSNAKLIEHSAPSCTIFSRRYLSRIALIGPALPREGRHTGHAFALETQGSIAQSRDGYFF